MCHITGTDNFDSVRTVFLNSVSAHYVVDKAGLVYQFVDEGDQAWHAGIQPPVLDLYGQGADTWRRYLFHFGWATYPSDATFVDRGLKKVADRKSAVFVARPDAVPWAHYGYFDTRWGAGSMPVNLAHSKTPNAYSVGIEILSVGSAAANHSAYTEPMYAALRALVADICGRHGIPNVKGRVVGHEDVNPVQRYGWDPNQGFDWTRIWSAG